MVEVEADEEGFLLEGPMQPPPSPDFVNRHLKRPSQHSPKSGPSAKHRKHPPRSK
ncbi:hypothetical protein U1Q18_039303, partial [Sarracenia purpurea var. burkii]